MGRSNPEAIPLGPTIKKHCKAIGKWGEYVKLREGLKLEGMTPREAAKRAYTELRIGELHQDYRTRESQATIANSGVSLTPAEAEKVIPDYKPPALTKGTNVGEEVLSPPEQIRWVKHTLARVRNGGGTPTSFPSVDTLYWYQQAISNPRDFDKIVLKMEAPRGDADDAMLRDGEYQFEQIESQLRDALKEVGDQFSEYESEFSKERDELLRVSAERSGEQSLVSA